MNVYRNEEYQAYVRRISFNVNLTGPQCVFLVAMNRKIDIAFSAFIPVAHALTRKGFVVHDPRLEYSPVYGRNLTTSTGKFTGEKPAYYLTTEGQLLAQLLEASGLPEIENLLAMMKQSDPTRDPA